MPDSPKKGSGKKNQRQKCTNEYNGSHFGGHFATKMSSNPKKRLPAARISDHSSDESDESCSENGYSGDEEQSSAEDVSSVILCVRALRVAAC